MAGMGLFLGISVSPVRMLVQGSGTATRMKAASFRNEIKRNPALQRELSHYLYAFMAQVAQTAACNRHHLVGARLCPTLMPKRIGRHGACLGMAPPFLPALCATAH